MMKWLRRLFGISSKPLAVFVDRTGSTEVEFQLFPRYISRLTVNPRDPESDAHFFMSGFESSKNSISERLGIELEQYVGEDAGRLDVFLGLAVECVDDFLKSGAPPYAPLARPIVNTVFFRKGQEIQTKRAIPVFAAVSYCAPASGGSDRKLPGGVKLRVFTDSDELSTSTSCELLEPFYSKLEVELVSLKERNDPYYGGYLISIENEIIKKDCLLLGSDSAGT